MAEDKRKSPDPADAARRRQPPTIDLTAQEIKADAAGGSSGAAPDTKPIYSDQDHVADTPTRDFLSGAEGKNSARAAAGRTSRLWFLVAGMAGGVAVAAVLFVMWLTGLVPIRYAGTTAMRARVGVLEMQVQDLSNRKPAVADKTAIDGLGARLAKLEQDIGKIPAGSPADSSQIAALESNVKALGVAVAGLSRRADEIAATAIGAREQAAAAGQSAADARTAFDRLPASISREDFAKLATRLAALESAAASTRTSAADHASLGAAVRFALAALALRETVAGGAPFAGDLAAVKAAGADAKSIAALEPFAATGVPGDSALARELLTLVPSIVTSSGVKTAAPGGFLDKLQANAGKLVRVRPANEKSGNDAPGIVARIEQLAAKGEAAPARAELAKLPASARAPAEQWMKKFDARNSAMAVASAIATGAIRALAQP